MLHTKKAASWKAHQRRFRTSKMFDFHLLTAKPRSHSLCSHSSMLRGLSNTTPPVLFEFLEVATRFACNHQCMYRIQTLSTKYPNFDLFTLPQHVLRFIIFNNADTLLKIYFFFLKHSGQGNILNFKSCKSHCVTILLLTRKQYAFTDSFGIVYFIKNMQWNPYLESKFQSQCLLTQNVYLM